MKEVIWLTVSRHQVVKMIKSQVQLERGQVPIKVNVIVDDAVFGAPTLEMTIHVTDWREGLAFDPELKEGTITEAEAELIRHQRLAAMAAALEARGYAVTAPAADDEDGRHAAPEAGTMRRCPLCPVMIQRTPDGTLADGMRLHYATVHPGKPVPHG